MLYACCCFQGVQGLRGKPLLDFDMQKSLENLWITCCVCESGNSFGTEKDGCCRMMLDAYESMDCQLESVVAAR
jgi:hypothetical protein